MFVRDDERVPIYTTGDAREGDNVIYIRARMDVATSYAVQGALMRLSADGKTAELDVGQSLLALLEYNIVGWAGPDFDGVPCTPANIRRLDPAEPIVQRAAEEIGRRNRREGADPKPSTSAGEPSSPAVAVTPLANGTPISRSRSATTGHRSK